MAPSCMQVRVVRGETLPRIILSPAAGHHTDGEDEEEDRKFRTMLNFLLGLLPSCFQAQVAGGQPSPRVALVPVTSDPIEEDDREARKFRNMLNFLLGMGGGPEGDGMPGDVCFGW